MTRSRRTISAGVAVLLASTLGTPPAMAQTPLGAATPQALVERMLKAADGKNFAEIVACLDPESRTEATMGLLLATTMMVAFLDVGAGMASGMAEGMAEAVSGEKAKPEDKAKIEKGKAEAAAKIAKTKTAYSALLKKHGLPDLTNPQAKAPADKGSAEALLAKVDQPTLAADLLAFMGEIGDKKDVKEEAGPPVPLPRDAKDFKITGDHATAKARGETLDFVRVSGRWFFKPPKKDAPK